MKATVSLEKSIRPRLSFTLYVPSILGSLVNVETRQGNANGAEKFVDAEEITVQCREDDFRGVSLFWYGQFAFLVPFHVLGGLLFHRGLVLFLAEGNRHEAVVGLCVEIG